MRFCEDHWADLRKAIDERGLTSLVSPTAEVALDRMRMELEERETIKESFDPLLHAHWAIVSNCFRLIELAGGTPLYFLQSGPEDPVDLERYGEQHRGRVWSRCPLCYLNMVHEFTCEGCKLDKIKGYDWMIERGADDSFTRAVDFGLVAKV